MLSASILPFEAQRTSHLWQRLLIRDGDVLLPIFFQDLGDRRIYYSPGFAAAVRNEQVSRFEARLASRDPDTLFEPSAALLQHAQQAVQAMRELLTQPFMPVCLTLYPTNRCNLHCSYCFAGSRADRSEMLEMSQVVPALELVIRNCRALHSPLTLVFHGGGEPTLQMKLIEGVVQLADRRAEEEALPTFYYLATNGNVSKQNAQWLADHFDSIGISCDGPAFIHDTQRPRSSGSGSLRYVEQTAKTLREAGTLFSVRVTITANSYLRMEEIAEYICRVLRPSEIHVELLYGGGRASSDLRLDLSHQDTFIEKYLRAEQIASEYGIPWLSSGSRPGNVHGPYCNVLRRVLNLVPGGMASACFKTSTMEDAAKAGLIIGSTVEAESNLQFVLDSRRIHGLVQKILARPVNTLCEECFNQYHCVGGCPDHCILDGKAYTPETDLRCSFQKLLTTKAILDGLNQILSEQSDKDVVGCPIHTRS